MDSVWTRLAWLLAAYPVAMLYGFVLLRHESRTRRRLFLLPVEVFVLSLPFFLPNEAKELRFFVSVTSSLAAVRLWETAEKKPADVAALNGLANFATFFSCASDLRFRDDFAWKRESRRQGMARLRRALLKSSSLALLLLALRAWPALLATPVVASVWCLLAAYSAATFVADAWTGLSMLLTGQRAAEVFQSPLLSRSPVEFWSQRWNLVFRNSAFRLVYLPLGGRTHPVWCTWAVFVFSALVHEYIVVAALERTSGHMTVFFLLHGCATVLNMWARKRFKRRFPSALGLFLNWGWMIATAPIFFAPILDILPLHWLWAW